MFRSQLENIMSAEELTFDPTPGFGSAYKKFLGHATAHPAKANTRLLEFLIKKFTCEGETVLDPMAGSGSTGVVAALHGRNAVQVDIERKFVVWAEEAKWKVEAQATLTAKGSIRNICGDSRKLSELLKNVDVVLTSPPYSQTISKHGGGKCRLKNVGVSTKTARSYDAIVTSPPYAIDPKNICHIKEGKTLQDYDKKRGFKPTMHPRIGYSPNEQNIGNLPMEKVDSIITSPPYGEAQDGHGIAKKGYQGKKHSPTDLVGNRSYMPDKFESEQNISRLKYDAVITSPPYARDKGGEKGMLTHDEKRRKDKTLYKTYGKNPENIDNLPYVDTVITSPPFGSSTLAEGLRGRDLSKQKDFIRKKHRDYGEIGSKGDSHQIGNLPFDAVITSPPYEGSLEDRKGGGILTREGAGPDSEATSTQNLLPCKYSSSKENIGNLKKETYLEAMLQVYSEMFKVLKPDGKAIIIIKPFIRSKKVVDLPWHTWLLLEKAGFKLVKLFKLRLQQASFWRVLYQKKYPSVPIIKHEYILVCQK